MGENSHLVMPEGHMEDLYKNKNPLIRWVHLQRQRNTRDLIPPTCKKILDVGCGEGHLLVYLNEVPGRKLFGVDVLSSVIKQAQERVPEATIKLAKKNRIPFENETFDAVSCIDVLEHVPDWRALIKEILRVTKTNGIIVLGWPNDDNWNFGRLLMGKGPVPDHINILTPRIVRQAIQRQPMRSKRIPFGFPWKICLTTQEIYKK